MSSGSFHFLSIILWICTVSDSKGIYGIALDSGFTYFNKDGTAGVLVLSIFDAVDHQFVMISFSINMLKIRMASSDVARHLFDSNLSMFIIAC